jgi:hypothetical protein
MATLVRFYVETDGILATFPRLKEKRFIDNGTKIGTFSLMAYASLGQHTVSRHDYHSTLPKATPEQYAPLKAELESLGYVLKVCK